MNPCLIVTVLIFLATFRNRNCPLSQNIVTGEVTYLLGWQFCEPVSCVVAKGATGGCFPSLALSRNRTATNFEIAQVHNGLSTSWQVSCSSHRNFAIRRCIRENLKRTELCHPCWFAGHDCRRVVPQRDFLGSQPDSLEILVQLVDKLGNTPIIRAASILA